MSDDSDYGTRNKRKRSARYLSSSPSTASTSSGSSIVASQHRQRQRFIEDDSDSDSGSSIEVGPKRKTVLRVDSDADSDSSGSVIVPRSKRPARVVSDSDSDSDHGFEGSSSSWETDTSDVETKNTAKKQDTGVESDASDGTSEKCPICLISFTNQEIGSPELCEHMFCIDCIQEWSKNMNTCPVDRREYNVILVRKGLNGKVYKRIEVQPPNPQNEVNIVEDPTFCEVCGSSDGEDRMLLCDGCDLGFHLECLEPPLTEVPIGAWFCHDCTPEDVVDPEIELYELQLLLDDANDLGRPRNARRTTASRLIPRTRQSERVRRRVVTNRSNQQVDSPQPVTSSTSTQRPKKKKKRKKKAKKPRYRVVYQLDEATGETIQVKKRVKKRKMKKRHRRAPPTPKTVRERLASQLGICAPSTVPQSLPSVRIQQSTNLQSQRYNSGIPTLRLFGDRDGLDYWVSEDEGDGSGVIARRGVSFRRNFVKNAIDPVSSSTDVLGSILEVQTAFHSKNATFSIGQNGTLKIEAKKERMLKELNNYSNSVRRVPTSSNEAGNDVPTSSENTSSPERNNTAPTSTVENSTEVAVAYSSASGPGEDNPENYNENLCSTHEDNNDKGKEKKREETPETNTPRSGTPASESEIDIYSDIETVTTSKQDEPDFKQPSPLPVTPSAATDDDNNDNDSDADLVIDTENQSLEVEETKEPEEAVTSTVETVDSNVEATPVVPTVTSSSEIQSQAVESSDKTVEKLRDEDEDSEDGCPNFSIYSRESITLAKNTDISLPPSDSQENNQVSEISSSPAEKPQETKPEETEKKKTGSGLYSDSEDETVVKKGLQNSFGIPDFQTMTEDISEEERSYTPCLDERPQRLIEGLETELISDEDRNDFDESHELKTASDGDALEINAKESELDFTRPEDYEEGEIVDKAKKKAEEKSKVEEAKKSEETTVNKDKENENQNTKESSFKKLSKSTKERNYRDKDKGRNKERSRSRDNKKDNKRDRKNKDKRKEIERYNVRALIAVKPRRDKFGRDINRSSSRNSFRTPPRRSPSRGRRSPSIIIRRSRSVSRRRSLSRGRKKKPRSKTRRSISRSRSPERRRSRSKQKKRKRSPSREKRRKSRDRSKLTKKRKSRSRQRTRSPSPKRTKEWRRNSREWTPTLSPTPSPELRHLSPSWTPPRIMDNPVRPHNLTVILANNGKKKREKRKREKRAKENEKQKRKKRNDRTPQPSKEVFASGDNILVSVSFNKDNETRDVSTKKKRDAEELRKNKKDKTKKKRKGRDLSGVKPVAIIDLEKSPFKELTPSPKDVIVLSDSDTEENRNMQKTICDSSQQVASPERLNSYTTGPKTPPEPQVKFTLAKQTTLRAITNPLHDPDDVEIEGDTQEDVEHMGPNTPPEPPNSPPSSPDVYDPFEPTKSRSATPEVMQTTQSISTLNLEDNRENSIIETRTEVEKSNTVQQPDLLKSLTPPLADVQPADSQSSVQITPESSLSKSPERSSIAPTTTAAVSKPIAQTIPFSSSVATSMLTSTPVSTSLAPPRINILNTTIITPSVSTIPQRIVLPNIVKSSPVKISPTKPPIKSTPIKPMLSKTPRKSTSRNQNGSDSAETNNLGLDSPYSPGSSDYEDLFDPPESVPKPAPKTKKSPAKAQNAFDALFGSPFNKVKTKPDKPAQSKFNKKSSTVSGTKQVGVKLDEDNLKILDELPNSAVEMQVKDKFLKKLNRQERVVEEVKLVLKPHYNKKHINKEEYKDILRRAVPKICHNKSGEINPTKIKNLIEAYVKKVRHSKKVTSSSSVNTQKA